MTALSRLKAPIALRYSPHVLGKNSLEAMSQPLGQRSGWRQAQITPGASDVEAAAAAPCGRDQIGCRDVGNETKLRVCHPLP